MACPYGLILQRSDEVNAAADGQNVFVNTGMFRFVENDDQLAIVIAHEIAHNVMRHLDGKKANTILGSLFGAIIDIGASAYGVNTGGEFAKAGAKAGALAFSQDFEREADYVGMYIVAATGRPLAQSPDFWRRMAQENASSIVFAGTHPTTAERFLRLDATASEIERKLALGVPLQPEMRGRAAVVSTRNAAGGRAPTVANRPADSPPRAAAASAQAVPVDSAPEVASPAVVPQVVPAVVSVRRDSVSPADAPAAVNPVPEKESFFRRIVPRRRTAPPSGRMTMPLDRNSRYVEWTFGPPVARDGLSVDQVIARAWHSYQDGVQAREVGWLDRARDYFYEATQFDGSVALYHAALGEVLIRQGLFIEAEAVLSAASLLEPENVEFRRMLGEARRGR